MAYVPLSSIEGKESSGGAELLPAGAYVCVFTDARLVKSKSSERVNLKLDWDVAEGEHVGHFGAAQYGHSVWLGIEGDGAAYTRHKLDRISMSNSQPPVTFNAAEIVDRYAAQFFAGGCVGELPITEFVGRYVGLVVGTSDELYKGNVQHRNDVAQWVTVAEARAGKYTDSKGQIRDIRIPAHKDKTGGARSAQSQPMSTADAMSQDEIPF